MTKNYAPLMRLPRELNEIFSNLETDMVHTAERYLFSVPSKKLMWENSPIVFDRSGVHCIGLQWSKDHKVEVLVRESDMKSETEKDFLTDNELVNILDLRTLINRIYQEINNL